MASDLPTRCRALVRISVIDEGIGWRKASFVELMWFQEAGSLHASLNLGSTARARRAPRKQTLKHMISDKTRKPRQARNMFMLRFPRVLLLHRHLLACSPSDSLYCYHAKSSKISRTSAAMSARRERTCLLLSALLLFGDLIESFELSWLFLLSSFVFHAEPSTCPLL